MPYSLTLSAQMTGVSDLQPIDDAEQPYSYTFKVQCTSCREVHAKEVFMNRFDTHELSGSRGAANFVWRCKACRRESSASILAQQSKYKGPIRPYTLEDSGKPMPIIEFETRGCEFVEFLVSGEWFCRGTESGTNFSDLDLSEGDWYDYDEKVSEEVSITDIAWAIKRT